METTFAAWLLQQSGRHDWIGMLASAAKADRSYPRQGDAVEIRKHLSARGAEPDMFEMLDDAEREWSRQ